MKTLRNQRGMTPLGILAFVSLFAFALTCGMRLIPSYMEYWAVKGALESLQKDESLNEKPLSATRRRLVSVFITNQIDVISVSSSNPVTIKRVKGKVVIDASYETRVPLFQNVDAVVKFENFIITIGETD